MPCSEGTVSNFLGGLLKSKASSGAVARLSLAAIAGSPNVSSTNFKMLPCS